MAALFLEGDARVILRGLPANHIQCVVTSPPYWGLRKYAGVPDLVWGGDYLCSHEWGDEIVRRQTGGMTEKQTTNVGSFHESSSSFCQCGAWRGSYGLEPTPEMYVEHTVEVLREVRRVLRDDGIVFWNIGDSYNAGRDGGHAGGLHGISKPENAPNRSGVNAPGLKPKDLVLIPFRVALAVQADGWWVRSVIIWNKSNPMPESVRDRPTSSHEYILMLTKSAKYYWDAEAVRELSTCQGGLAADFRRATKDHVIPNQSVTQHRLNRESTTDNGGRNIRSVWSFSTEPYKGNHYAAYPTKLPETCIKAATSEKGCCSKCGSPLERVLSKGQTSHDAETESEYDVGSTANRLAMLRQAARANGGEYVNTARTVGWQVTCDCRKTDSAFPVIDGLVPTFPYPVVPCRVLDPFSGVGTTAMVAERLGIDSFNIDTSAEYIALSEERLADDEDKRAELEVKQIMRDAGVRPKRKRKEGTPT